MKTPIIICAVILVISLLYNLAFVWVFLPTNSERGTLTLVANDYYSIDSVVLKQYRDGKCIDEYELKIQNPFNRLDWRKYKLPEITDEEDTLIKVHADFSNGSSAEVTYESRKALYKHGLLIYLNKVYDWGYVCFVSGENFSSFGKNTVKKDGERIETLTPSGMKVELPKVGYDYMSYNPGASGKYNGKWIRTEVED